MASGDANTSMCASTGASPAGTVAVGTGHSALAPNALVLNDATTATGGGGGSSEPVVIPDEEDGEFTGEVEPVAKRQKKCTSKVWDYFIKYTDKAKNKVTGVEEQQRKAKCKKCGRVFGAETVNGTKHLWNHLNRIHSLKQGQQELQVKGEVQTFRYDPEVSLEKWYIAVIMHEYPFSMVDHVYFNEFIHSLRPSFEFKCRITTSKAILEIFEVRKRILYDELKFVSSRISTTMDMWTSNQNKAYMCITAHWIDENWLMQKRILKFIHIDGKHTGTRLANAFVKGVMSMNIEKKLFALTLDNASSNDKCAREVVIELNKLFNISKVPPLMCDGAFFHVRCLCHILNLVAQDGLKIIAHTIQNIRTTIGIVKNSTLQWEEFQKCAVECDLNNNSGLPLDVPTRWNSTYDMLKQAIYYRGAFERLLFLDEDRYQRCAPSAEEWGMAESLCNCLEKFNDATLLFSGCLYPTANLFWWKFCEIKLALREWCASADVSIASMAVAMQLKYDKYWDKSNLALAVACFLDPRYKQKLVIFFLQKIYPDKYEEEFKRVLAAIDKFFRAYKSCVARSSKPTAAGSSENSQPHGNTSLGHNEIEKFLYDDAAANKEDDINELDVYMKEKPIRWVDPTGEGVEFDILAWWKSNQMTFPILSTLARDVMAVQISTVASESAFSAGGRVVGPFRSSLDPEMIEALVCTKDWIRASRKGNCLFIFISLFI